MGSFKSKLLNGFVWRLCFYTSSFILNILIANKFGPEGLGSFYLLLNNVAFAVLLLNAGLESAVAYFTSRQEISTGKLLSLSVVWSLLVTAGLFLYYFTAVHYNWMAPYELAPWLIITVGGSLLAGCETAILFSTEDNSTPNFIFTLMNILLMALLPGVVFLKTGYPVADYTKIYLLVTALPSLAFVICLHFSGTRLSFRLPGSFWFKKIIDFAMQSFIYGLLYALLLRCDYWLVHYFCSASDLGNYLQANKLTQIILLVPILASYSLFPLIVSHIHKGLEISRKLLKLVSIYFYIGLVMSTGVIMVGYWIFPMLYGAGFSKMYPSFVLLSPGILMLAAAYPLSTFYSGKNLIRLKITALSLSIIILLILDVLLIPGFSIYGAAISSTMAYTFYFLYLLFSFRKTVDFKIEDLFKIRAIIKENMPAVFTKNNSHED